MPTSAAAAAAEREREKNAEKLPSYLFSFLVIFSCFLPNGRNGPFWTGLSIPTERSAQHPRDLH
jgi:hypothetical protein